MKSLVVYESMYGNTHTIAIQIAQGLARAGEASVIPVDEATPELIQDADLLVVGGPTHGHGMSSSTTRQGAVDTARKPDSDLTLDPDAEGPGLRDWFKAMAHTTGTRAAAFDTRLDAPGVLTGHASRGITRRLRKHGYDMVAEPESFLVTKQNTLVEGETERAVTWGTELAQQTAGVS